jgi:hypothetical protein
MKTTMKIKIINAIKYHSYEAFVNLLQSLNNDDFEYIIIKKSLKYNNVQSFKHFINRLDCIPYSLLHRLLGEKYNIEFIEITLDRLEKLEFVQEDSKVHKIYAQLLASLLLFHTNIEHLVQRILNNQVFNFEKFIKDEKFRIKFIRISLNHKFRVQNLKNTINLIKPYYIKNNIPLEELLYVTLNRYRYLKKTFVLKQFSSFKGILDLDYRINLDVTNSVAINYFNYEEEEYDIGLTIPEEVDTESYSINNIKLGSLLLYFNMDINYFIRKGAEFIEDNEDMEEIKGFKTYFKIS